MKRMKSPTTSKTPSKRVIALIVACILIVGAIVATKWDRTPIDATYESENAGPLIAVEGALKISSNTDTDNDGLRDWEEVIWKTDPNNPDTDGDGTTDGEEIDAERDPTKKGPDDKISFTSSTETSANIIPENLNETEKLSRDLFVGYIEARKSPDFTSSAQSLVDSLVIKQSDPKNNKYTEKNIFIVQDSGLNSLEAYAHAMGKIILENPPKSSENELEIMDSALSSQNPNKLNDLDPIIAGYQNIINGFARVAVPNELANNHVELLNNLDAILTDLKNFKSIFSDPIIGFSALARYQNDAKSMQTTLETMQAYFQYKNVSFEQDEYGYAFVNVI